jgi:hypothetical protein
MRGVEAGKTPAISGGSDELHSRLHELISSSSFMLRALHLAQTVAPPDWLIVGEVIRNLVWDRLHGLNRAPSKDVDLLFFDPESLDGDRELSVGMLLTSMAPDISWHVTNQAAAHLWYPEVRGAETEPFTCSADAVASWPETATAIAIRLLPNQTMKVLAPCGLDDLFGLISRRNPSCATDERCRRRVESRQIAERWPRVRVVDS